jgi:two-component system, OmpR family, heavy metal sensor histidine kinase CusS
MPSKRAEPRAIATQLVFLFTIAAALLLSTSLGIFYWMVVRHSFAEDNAVLADKTSAVVAELQRTGSLTGVSEQFQPVRTGEPSFLYVRILDGARKVIAETPQMATFAPLESFSPARALDPQASGARRYLGGGRLFYLLATKVNVQGQTYTVQVAQDRSEDEEFRREFRILFFVVLNAGVLVAALIAISVTRRGLEPLAKLTRSLERVRPTHLHERIDPAKWPRELQPVAAAFDGMLERLEDSFARLSQFSADLAHELRTPVGNILGEAQVTLTRARSPDEYRAALESTVAECERLSLIVDNLLFLARAEAQDRQIERSVLDGRGAAEKIAAYYQTIAEDRKIRITCSGEGEVFADPLLFERALGNVVDNALRFTPEGGEIRIGLTRMDGQVEVTVSDTGAGISDEALPHVFDRFFRADPSRSSSGTGLGLSLVRSIMDLHGGSASIESKLARGTTVILSFPTQ